MRTIRARLRALRSEDGVGITEVVVALMVFSLIAVGIAYSMFSMTRLTKDSTNRETASHLAAQEIDRIHSLLNAFSVYSSTATKTVNGIPYTVDTSVGWVSTTGAGGSCGSGGGNLQYKRVNVAVTWPGMYLQNPVRADSVLSPDSRINDPSYGTVLVSVLGADGTGRSGVTVRVTPESGGGGVAMTDPIPATDADGCTYVLKVAPGKYKVEVDRSNYIDANQVLVPSYVQQTVAAGSTISASFQYDAAGSFALAYSPGITPEPYLPSNLETTYVGGLANLVKTGTASPQKLHPFPSGYQAVAGVPSACLNVDPDNWTAGSATLDGARAAAVAAAPGGAATLPIPMGVVNLTVPNGTDRYVTAVQQTASGDGNPGCATPKSYTFTTLFAPNEVVPLALPYGTWKFYTGNSIGATSNVRTTGITVVTGTGTFVGEVATLDPRSPA